MSVSVWQIALVLVLVVLLFGRGKISELMGDVAKGIKSFKKGMADDEAPADPAKVAQTVPDPDLRQTQSQDTAVKS